MGRGHRTGEPAIRILLAEDDEELAVRLLRGLNQAGFVVERARHGDEALELGRDPTLDAIVLDLGLPKRQGLDVLADLRLEGVATPVLILTAQGTWAEKVQGLNQGADDYLTKPFHMPELVARLNALVRRAAGFAQSLLRHGDLSLDVATGEVLRSGEQVELTALEFRMLKFFMMRPRHVVSQGELVEHLYSGEDARESNTVEVYISRLRRKIGAERIRTIRGLGYRFG